MNKKALDDTKLVKQQLKKLGDDQKAIDNKNTELIKKKEK